MKSKLFTIGPTQLYPGVEKYLIKSLKKGTITLPHRSPQFSEIVKNTQNEIRDFFKVPKNYQIYFTYSATNAMEIISKSIPDNTCHITNGLFGDLWVDTAKSLKKEIEHSHLEFGQRVEIDQIKTTKKNLIFTANDTSSGVSYSPKEFKEIRTKFKNKIICIDATSSFGCLAYDINSADAWIFSVQKGLGLPPGLGLVIVNEKIINSAKKLSKTSDIGGHHSLISFETFQKNFHTPSTPNIMLIDALGFIVKSMKKDFKTIKNLEKHTIEKSKVLYNYFSKNNIEIVAQNNKSKSLTTIVIKPESKILTKIKTNLEKKSFIVSPGYGANKDKHLRIANFPQHSLKDITNLIKSFNLK